MAGNNFKYALPVGSVLKGGEIPGRKGEHFHYKVENILGQGSFGITYSVSDQVPIGNIRQRMSFAVKELFVKEYCSRDEDGVTIKYSAEYSNNFKEELHNFVQEANRLYRICKGNDNIVNVNEVFQANGTAYYVMDNITGGNLRSLCHGAPLPESRVLALMEPIAKAVEYVHNQHYMHFDIKPDNIMLRQNSDGSESPVLIDFGISMHFNDRGNTTEKYAPGTSAGYSPKEQYEPVTKFTPAIDVYALAATYFYLLTGHDPVISQQVYPGYVAKHLPLDVSEVTRQAIAEGMKPLWSERPQSVAKFLAGFRESYTLKQGYILKSPHLSYYIFSVEDESSCYIHYKAVPYHGSSYNGNDANVTQTTIYDIYECFVAKFMSRAKDGSIQMPDGMTTLPSFAQFNDLAKRWSGLDEMGKDKDLPLSCEWFKANNTQYVVVKKGFKPTPHWKPVLNTLYTQVVNYIKRNKLRVGIVSAVLVLISLFSVYLQDIQEWIKKQSDNSDSTAIRLSDPSNDGTTKKPNNSDSEADADLHYVVDYPVYIENTTDTDYLYTGTLLGRLPHGKGKATYMSKGSRKTYSGDFRYGKRESLSAELEMRNGDTFVGSFENDHFKKGKYTVKEDGSYFSGDFKNDKPYNGEWRNADGSLYLRIVNGKRTN